MNRRDFIKLTALGATAALKGPQLLTGQTALTKSPGTTVAIPISAAPLADPDFDRQLADMHERGGVNVLMPFIYTH